MGLTAAREYANTLIQQAIDALQLFDERADRLRQLAEFVVIRKN